MQKTTRLKISALIVAAAFAFAIILAGCSAAVPQAAAPQQTAQATEAVAAVSPDAAQAGAHYTISLDINPSIELEVTDGLVTGVVAYNDDAAALDLASLVIGLDPDQAVQVLVQTLAEDGYLEPGLNPYLVITVSDEPDSPQIAQQLELTAMNTLDTLQIECTVKSAVITQEISQTAAGYGLSSGKYLILEYIAQQEGITLDEAIELYGSYRISDLMAQFEGAQELFVGEAEGEAWRAEQLAEAVTLFEQEMHQVMDTFHAAFKAVKDTYKSGVQNLKDTYGNAGDPQYRTELKVLKDDMLSGKQAALTAMKSGKETAWANLLQAALALGYTQEDVQAYLDMADSLESEAMAEADSLTAESFTEESIENTEDANEETGKPSDPGTGNSASAKEKDKVVKDNPGKAVGKDKNADKQKE